MNNPFDFFDVIFCNNLDRRTDRWLECQKEFGSVGIIDKVIRHSAVEHESPPRGNGLSHAYMIQYAKDHNLDNILIFEDDVNFFRNALKNLEKSLKDLPPDWDMFYLGANLDTFPAYKVTDNLAKITGAFATHAYAVRHTIYDKVIAIGLDDNTPHNDVYYATFIHPNHNCFLAMPLVAGQRDSFSDIQHKVMSSNTMFQERLKNNLRNK
jgi:hypothetical protein